MFELKIADVSLLPQGGIPFPVFSPGIEAYENVKNSQPAELVDMNGKTVEVTVQQKRLGNLYEMLSNNTMQVAPMPGRTFDPSTVVDQLEALYPNHEGIGDVRSVYTVVTVVKKPDPVPVPAMPPFAPQT